MRIRGPHCARPPCFFITLRGLHVVDNSAAAGRCGQHAALPGHVALAILGLAVLMAIAFPLGGAAIAFIAVVDFLLPKRVKEAGSAKA